MQKNKLWIMLFIIVVMILAFILWLRPDISPDATSAQPNRNAKNAQQSSQAQFSARLPSFASFSQQDTEMNCQMTLDRNNRLQVNEQTRNCFEYFITQYGEKNLEQIQQDFKSYTSQQYKEPALAQILDLWTRYLDYRQSLGQLTAPTGIPQDDPAYYRSIYTSTQSLRKKFFSNYEIEGLFGTEDAYHEYTLDRMQILADNILTEAEKAQKLKDLFAKLPEDWQENLEQLNKLDDLRKLTADIKARGGSQNDIRQMRLNLVGPEATQRLEHLDGERAAWKSNVNQYLNERDQILTSGMSDNAKQQAIQSIRQQHFKSPEERLRLETYEQVHDQGEKLPFPD